MKDEFQCVWRGEPGWPNGLILPASSPSLLPSLPFIHLAIIHSFIQIVFRHLLHSRPSAIQAARAGRATREFKLVGDLAS